MKRLIILLAMALLATGCAANDQFITPTSQNDKPPSSQFEVSSFIVSDETVSQEIDSSELPSTSDTTSYESIWEEEPVSSAPSVKAPVSSAVPSKAPVSSAPPVKKAPASSVPSVKAPVSSVAPSKAPVSSAPPAKEPTSSVPVNIPVEENNSTVYWGASGTKYHSDKGCRSFKGNTPNSGSINDAKAAGRDSWCKICT